MSFQLPVLGGAYMAFSGTLQEYFQITVNPVRLKDGCPARFRITYSIDTPSNSQTGVVLYLYPGTVVHQNVAIVWNGSDPHYGCKPVVLAGTPIYPFFMAFRAATLVSNSPVSTEIFIPPFSGVPTDVDLNIGFVANNRVAGSGTAHISIDYSFEPICTSLTRQVEGISFSRFLNSPFVSGGAYSTAICANGDPFTAVNVGSGRLQTNALVSGNETVPLAVAIADQAGLNRAVVNSNGTLAVNCTDRTSTNGCVVTPEGAMSTSGGSAPSSVYLTDITGAHAVAVDEFGSMRTSVFGQSSKQPFFHTQMSVEVDGSLNVSNALSYPLVTVVKDPVNDEFARIDAGTLRTSLPQDYQHVVVSDPVTHDGARVSAGVLSTTVSSIPDYQHVIVADPITHDGARVTAGVLSTTVSVAPGVQMVSITDPLTASQARVNDGVLSVSSASVEYQKVIIADAVTHDTASVSGGNLSTSQTTSGIQKVNLVDASGLRTASITSFGSLVTAPGK